MPRGNEGPPASNIAANAAWRCSSRFLGGGWPDDFQAASAKFSLLPCAAVAAAPALQVIEGLQVKRAIVSARRRCPNQPAWRLGVHYLRRANLESEKDQPYGGFLPDTPAPAPSGAATPPTASPRPRRGGAGGATSPP